MGSDRARLSWDPRRQWRSVVRQQGRVTLEAEENEADQLAGEALREETLEIVGADGTPDDGYRILPSGSATAPPYEIEIGGGTMYVGGVRVHLFDSSIKYSSQPDWLNPDPADPLWVDPSKPADGSKANELIYLLLIEQEVGAVEDTALREVALGGPDSAQRTRLLQRVVRLGTDATDCATALADLAASWSAQGMDFDASRSQLLSRSGLVVSFPQQGSSGDLCEPAATGGYLKPDNQLIRVQVVDSQAGQGAPGTGTLVWGYDDGSFLYRAKVVDGQTLQLASRPVDEFHRPRTNQVVEVLRSTSQLVTGADPGASEPSPNDFVASPIGFFTSLTKDYDPDTQKIALQSALPAGFSTDSTPIFVRIWEAQVSITEGTAAAIGDTGMEVVVANKTPAGPLHPGDAWLIAVRPTTPTEVYPERLLDQPQPPDSPRMWVCPLGMVKWSNGVLELLEDCRNPFDNLVDLTRRKAGGCCDVSVTPSDLQAGKTLQSIVDAVAGREATICLSPGAYSLPEPLRLTSKHSHLTIEACHDGVVLQALAVAEEKFLDGLVVLTRADGVTLRGLRFELPQVPYAKAGGSFGGLTGSAAVKALGRGLENLYVSVGVRPVHCARLTIERCLFRYSLTRGADVFGAGVFAGSECWGHRILQNRFLLEEDYEKSQQGAFRLLAGYLLTPTIGFGLGKKPSIGSTPGRTAGRWFPSLLTDAVFRDNLFSGLGAAGIFYAACGQVEIGENTVTNSEAGFLMLSLRAMAYAHLINEVQMKEASAEFASQYASGIVALLEYPLIQVAAALGRAYPLPGAAEEGLRAVEVKAGSGDPKAELAQAQAIFDRARELFKAPAGEAATPQPAGGAGAEQPPAAGGAADQPAGGGGWQPPAGVGAAEAAAAASAGLSARRAEVTAKAISLDRVAALHTSLSVVERGALLRGEVKRGLELSLQFEGNRLDTFLPKREHGPDLLVWSDEGAGRSAFTCTGNQLRTGSRLPALAAYLVARCAVAGNVVVNEGDGLSLLLMPIGVGGSAEVAATGNVLHGRTQLPARSLPPPLDSWDVFNSVS